MFAHHSSNTILHQFVALTSSSPGNPAQTFGDDHFPLPRSTNLLLRLASPGQRRHPAERLRHAFPHSAVPQTNRRLPGLRTQSPTARVERASSIGNRREAQFAPRGLSVVIGGLATGASLCFI
ncbi:hypothetical protein BKA56DRAFT_275249 [Ilyonectria sp. MPI-CAGE-AT-0026]|nr:hypothetical protein BKA56DRAFT_275249 [Ilyonectria sp. MPI-CAGE-AT-0026]